SSDVCSSDLKPENWLSFIKFHWSEYVDAPAVPENHCEDTKRALLSWPKSGFTPSIAAERRMMFDAIGAAVTPAVAERLEFSSFGSSITVSTMYCGLSMGKTAMKALKFFSLE